MLSNVIDSERYLAWGDPVIINEDKIEVRRYLLGQLDEAEEERLELRLLTDAAFIEEFDTIVDEMADQYAGDEFHAAERERVEQYFLRSAERQQKAQFAKELLEHAATERSDRRAPVETTPGFFERLRAFWSNQSFAPRMVTAFATIVIVVGLAFLIRPVFFGTSEPDALITLNLITSDRASGSGRESVKLEPGTRGLRIELTLPEQAPQAQSYRVELLDDQQRSRDLPIQERTPKSLIVRIPADEVTRGSYIIQLYAVEQRIRGSYYFNVE